MTHYVLIDYENVQPDAMETLDKDTSRVLVFVGANQAKVTFQVASVLQRMGKRAEYIKISNTGSNAMDFHIAFYIGHLAAKDPEATFHIVSKDTGFDPLIAHLKTKKIHASRFKEVTEAPVIKTTIVKTADDKMGIVLENLTHRGISKPKTVKTVVSTIRALFRNQISEVELSDILAELQRKKAIVITGTKVTYNLS